MNNMRDRRKRNIVIGILCCLLVFMGVIYALLNQRLTLTSQQEMIGEWNIKITNIVPKTPFGRAKDISHSYTNTTANFEAELYMPGDSIEYEVTVENQGNIKGMVQSVTPSTTNKSDSVKFSHTEIPNILSPGDVKTFTMKVEIPESSTTIPPVGKIKYSLTIVYAQYDGKTEVKQVSDSTDESCFMVNQYGILLAYNQKCGTDHVVVPKTINGVTLIGIYKYAFSNNFGIVNGENAYFWDEDSKSEAMKMDYFNDINFNNFTNLVFNGEIVQTVDTFYGSFDPTKVYMENGELKWDSVAKSEANVYMQRGSDSPSIYGTTNLETYELLMSECFSNKVEEAYIATTWDGAGAPSIQEQGYCTVALDNPASIILPPNSYGTVVLYKQDVTVDPYYNTLDLSQATGITQSVGVGGGIASTIIMPPNLYNLAYATGLVGTKNVIFPNNTTTKFAASVVFASETGVFEVPKSFEIIKYAEVAENIEKIILHSNIKYFDFRGTKNLKSIVIKSKNEILGLKDGDKVHVGQDIYATVSYEK